MLIFDIELSAPCNAKCDFCPQSWKGVKRKKPYLDENLLVKIMKEIKQISRNEEDGVIIDFCGMGENLLRKDLLLKALDTLFNGKTSGGQLDIRLTTNGYYLTKDLVTNPLFQKINQIEISLASTLDKKKYEDIYKIDYDTVKNNVMNLKKYFKNKVIITSVELSKLKDDMDDFKSFWENYSDEFLIHEYHNRGGDIKDLEANVLREYTRDFNYCAIFYFFVFISSDGYILACCNDVKSKHIVGDLNKESILSIIKRKRILQKNKKGFEICKNCTDSCVSNLDNFMPVILKNI